VDKSVRRTICPFETKKKTRKPKKKLCFWKWGKFSVQIVSITSFFQPEKFHVDLAWSKPNPILHPNLVIFQLHKFVGLHVSRTLLIPASTHIHTHARFAFARKYEKQMWYHLIFMSSLLCQPSDNQFNKYDIRRNMTSFSNKFLIDFKSIAWLKTNRAPLPFLLATPLYLISNDKSA
jgi:hypothetical protein